MVLQCSTYNYNTNETSASDSSCVGQFEKCARNIDCPQNQDHHCFAVFQKSPNSTNGLSIISAGCNQQFDFENCTNECVGAPRARGVFYCCCNNDNCNRNPMFPPQTQQIINVTTPTPPVQHDSLPNYIILIAALIVTTIVIVTFIKKRPSMLKRGRRRKGDSNERDESNNRLMNHNNTSDQRNNTNQRAGDVNACQLSDLKNNNHTVAFLLPLRNQVQQSGAPNHHVCIGVNQQNDAIRTSQNDTQSYDQQPQHQQQLQQQQQHSYTRIDLKDIKLLEIIGSGRFGTVHKATVESEKMTLTTTLTINSAANGSPAPPATTDENYEHLREFAIKVIPASEFQSWQNELKIYSSSKTRHPNILNFLGSCQHVESNCYWLFVEYASKGSLHHYLKHNTISWNEFLSISLGIVHGLSHLHDADVAHRDFKSKNVLLKHNLSPCITDFGVAAMLDISGGSQTEQRKKYLQVGTPRYMAPEVLECSVTFTKTSFTKIDVYALSLVLWELISRCFPLPGYQYRPTDQAPPYSMPFEDVVGSNPDINTMRQIVINEKQRPPIKHEWQSYPVSKFCQAMIDGWEYDHDARISASCFVERIESIQQQLQLQQQHQQKIGLGLAVSPAAAVVHSTA